MGNTLNATLSTGPVVVSFAFPETLLVKPVISLLDAALGTSGAKVAAFRAIDQQVDEFKSNRLINSQTIGIESIKSDEASKPNDCCSVRQQ